MIVLFSEARPLRGPTVGFYVQKSDQLVSRRRDTMESREGAKCNPPITLKGSVMSGFPEGISAEVQFKIWQSVQHPGQSISYESYLAWCRAQES